MSPTALRIGDFRHRITFQREREVPDDSHGHTSLWDDVATVWAKVEPVSGNEFYYAMQLKNAITHKITVRYRNDITDLLRIIFEKRIMKIESLINIQEREKFIQLRCVEDS